MHWLDVIGLESFEGHMAVLDTYADKAGKIFPGYSGEYHYANLGYAEVIFHYEADGKGLKLIGFNSHAMSENKWVVEVGHDKPVVMEGDDRMSKCPRFKVGVIGGGRKPVTLPIRLIHSDVLPCFSPGEQIEMQVAAFPYEIHYSPLRDRWSAKTGRSLMATIVHAYGNIMGGNEDQCSSVLEAKVKHIEKRDSWGYDGKPVTFYAVTVGTAYGDIEICHTLEMVPKEERQYFKEGSCVFAWVSVQGDVAIGKYQEGAVYDEEHLVKLLQDAFENADFSRAEKVLKKDAVYCAGGAEIKGKKKVIDALKGMYGKKVHAHTGKQGERPVLILADPGPSSFERLVFIEMDGKEIKKITSTAELGELSITEAFRYRKDRQFIILKIMSDMLYEKDCARLLNYLAGDVVYEDAEGETEGYYTALKKLEDLCENEGGGKLDAYVVEATVPGNKYGKLGLALSSHGVNESHKVIFITLKEGKVTRIKVTDNKYRLEELRKGYFGDPPQTVKGWLEFFRYWVIGKPMPGQVLEAWMGRDCVFDMVNCGIMSKKTGRPVSHIEKREDIFFILTELLLKPLIGSPCKIEGNALVGEKFRLTLECGPMKGLDLIKGTEAIMEIKAIKFEAILPIKYH